MISGEDDWSEEARLFVQALTCGQVLQAQIYDYAEDGSPLVYLYSKLGNEVNVLFLYPPQKAIILNQALKRMQNL